MTENSQTKIGDYFLLQKIEEGGMADIFLVQDSQQQKFVIKKLKKEFSYDKAFIQLLRSEVETLQSLNHPHIVKAYHFISTGEETYAVLEHLQAYTLRQVIDRHEELKKNIPWEITTNLILQLTKALKYIHNARDASGKSLGIIHSDLNPRNILINQEGSLKLIDFSIAQTAENKMGDTQGVGRGVISYMSPEQAQSEAIDTRSDLFSVGILLHEMLVGEMPFAGKSRFEVFRNLMSRDLKADLFPSSLPLPLVHLTLKCLQRNKEDRYDSAASLKNDLKVILKTHSQEMPSSEIAKHLSSINFY